MISRENYKFFLIAIFLGILVVGCSSVNAIERACRGADPRLWDKCKGKLNLRGSKYEGEFRRGKPEGKGSLRWDDGTNYYGEFRAGELHGFGKLSRFDQSSYEGIFSRGELTGVGISRLPNGSTYKGDHSGGVPHGKGEWLHPDGSSYIGTVAKGLPHGEGTSVDSEGKVFVGTHRFGRAHGFGSLRFPDARPPIVGIWEDHRLVRVDEQQVIERKSDSSSWDFKSNFLSYLEGIFRGEHKASMTPTGREKPPTYPNPQLVISTSVSVDDEKGMAVLSLQVNDNISLLTVDGREEIQVHPGRYKIERYVKVGETKFNIIATDQMGANEAIEIEVVRRRPPHKDVHMPLSPHRVPFSPTRDSVAIIIGIEQYKRSPKAEYASHDARAFFDYSRRAFGVLPENVLLLLNDEADIAGVLRALKGWLPNRVKAGRTDVFLFFSGHGLSSQDGETAYLLPYDVDQGLLERTAISMAELIALIDKTLPKSAVLFLDSCYIGLSRTGESLLSTARPISIVSKDKVELPKNFTVISASASNQIASSSSLLKHGIFSYFLMRGLEGLADTNKDTRISVAEMEAFLLEHVPKFATELHRTQRPQVLGDSDTFLVSQ